MVQLELEFAAVLVGAVTYSLYLLFPFRALSRGLKKAGAAARASEPSPEPEAQAGKEEPTPSAVAGAPTGEPSPEPEVGEDDPAPSAAFGAPADESSPEPTPAPKAGAVPGATTKSGHARAPPRRWLPAGAALVCVVAALVCVVAALFCAQPGLDGEISERGRSMVQEPVLALPTPSSGIAGGEQISERGRSMVQEPVLALPTPSSGIAGGERGQGATVSWKLTRQEMRMQQIGGRTHYRSAYWGTVTLGTPPVTFKVVFDTGSGQLIVPSTYCRTASCRLHTRYKRSASSSAKDIDGDGTVVRPGASRDTITVTFGTGEVTGVFQEERLCVDADAVHIRGAGLFEKNETSDGVVGCMDMRVIAAIDMPDDPFKGFEFDGILGLGLAGLAQSPEFNFQHMLAKALQAQGATRPHVFAVFLAEDPAEQSEITFGGWIDDQHVGDIVWAPVYEPDMGHWMVEIRSLMVDGEGVDFCADGQCRAVVDTGTSLLAVPRSGFKTIFGLLRHAPTDGKCEGPGPVLQFDLGGIVLDVGPQDYATLMVPNTTNQTTSETTNATTNQTINQSAPNQTSVSGSNGTNQTAEANATQANTTVPSVYCKPLLMAMEFPAPLGPKLFILGEPILRKYLTVYDTENKQVGFSRARHNPKKLDDANETADPAVAAPL